MPACRHPASGFSFRQTGQASWNEGSEVVIIRLEAEFLLHDHTTTTDEIKSFITFVFFFISPISVRIFYKLH